MDRGLATVIGMSIAYVASFLGLAFAWFGWRKRQREGDGPAERSGGTGGASDAPGARGGPVGPGAGGPS